MNIDHYISSGIIENYVLGLCSGEESAEVESMAMEHSEVREAIETYRKTLESFGSLHGVPPPDGLRQKILNAIEKETSHPSGTIPRRADPEYSSHPTIRRWKRLATAASILLIVSLAVNGLYITRYHQSEDRFTALVQSQEQLVIHNQAIETRIEKMEKDMQMLMNPAMKSVLLKGVSGHPGMLASLYWDPRTRETYLGSSNLPSAPSGKDYQLWAIVDGKPVDMGLYHPSRSGGPVPMKKVISGKVQAFAITLEPQGGSPTPTMDQMYVMGNI